MPRPMDAAALERLKEALSEMTPRPWLKGFGSTVGTIIASNPPPPQKAGTVARTFNRELDADGIVALVNAAPALVAGCETLLRIQQWLIDEGFMDEAGIKITRKPTHGNCCTCQTCGWWHDDCVCDSNRRWAWWLAALDAAREEPTR